MSIESQFVEAMEEDVIPEVGEQVAERWREEARSNLEESYQGAPDLVEFVGEVEQEGENFVFRINHPVAPLHEKGGHIEPTYAQSMAMGWTRDGFYEALQDCEEWVEEKRYMRDAVYTMKTELR